VAPAIPATTALTICMTTIAPNSAAIAIHVVAAAVERPGSPDRA
jgi:hypothetical protein